MAAAEASGIPINLTHIAVGDGAGNPTTPNEAQTMLVHEMFRAEINTVYRDPVQTTKYTAEMIIPASEGGFTLREIGIFDADGSLFAVGNLPATYKPNIAEGSYSDTVVRMEFLVTNADVVNIMVDPDVVVVTRTWLANNVTPATIIPGGTTGQALLKDSNADGDFSWYDLNDVNVTVDMIEENQVLAALQTTVTMTICTTRGLAVHIEGVRLPKIAGVDGWQIAGGGTSLTQITLGKAYPATTKITLTQNEPTGSAPAPLERSQNLADVASAATSRTNLDVYSKAETDQKTPTGAVVYFPRSTAPAGWLKANGADISRVAYANLFAVIGTTFGAGDGFNTFGLPEIRGEFIRGLDDSRGIDVGRTLGSAQADAFKAHTHTVSEGSVTPSSGGHLTSGDDHTDFVAFTQTTSSTGGTETRPRNIALLACIKY